MRNSIFQFILWIWLPIICCLCGCLNTPAQPGRYTVIKLGKIPDAVNLQVTADSRHIMYVRSLGAQQQVIFDGHAGPVYDGVYIENSFISADSGKHIAYATATNKAEPGDCPSCGPPGKWRAIVDDHEADSYDKVAGITFDHGGNQVAYAAMKKRNDGSKHWLFVVNGKEDAGNYDAVTRRSPLFSPDGKTLVGVIRSKNDKSQVIINGIPEPPYDYIGNGIPMFSPNGMHMAYSAVNYTAHGACVIFDGKPGPQFDIIPENSLVFSPDSKHFAYGSQTLDEWHVVYDHQLSATYAQVDNLTFSPDSKHFAFKGFKAGKWCLILDGKEVLKADSLMKGFPVFSTDSKQLACGYKGKGQWQITCKKTNFSDDRIYIDINDDHWDDLRTPVFSPNSRDLSYIVHDLNKQRMIVNGSAGEAFDEILSPLVYSPEGNHTAYLGKNKIDGRDKYIFVIDGKASEPYDNILRGSKLIICSSNSQNVAYAASIGNRWYLIINGQKCPMAYEVICSLANEGENGFQALAIDKHQLQKIIWRPK